MKKSGVPIFLDIDGTLWDTRHHIVTIWNDTFEKMGYGRPVTFERLSELMGQPMEAFGCAFFPDMTREAFMPLMHVAEQAENEGLQTLGGPCLYEGVAETIRTLSRDHFIAIASNCQKGYIETFMDVAGVADCVDDHIANGDTGLPKGENLKLLMARNGIDRGVYVGDTSGDASAAAFAGLDFIWCRYGFGQDVKKAGIDSICQLVDVIGDSNVSESLL